MAALCRRRRDKVHPETTTISGWVQHLGRNALPAGGSAQAGQTPITQK